MSSDLVFSLARSLALSLSRSLTLSLSRSRSRSLSLSLARARSLSYLTWARTHRKQCIHLPGNRPGGSGRRAEARDR